MKPFIAGLIVAIGESLAAAADGRTVDVAIGSGIFFFGLTWAIASLMRMAIKYGSSSLRMGDEYDPLQRGTPKWNRWTIPYD